MASRGVNKVILVGNLGQDPEVRFMPAGGAVANFTIATSESWKDKQTGEQKERTEWHRIVMYNRLAEIAGEYLRKGSKVYVEGRLQTRKWQDQQGQERYTTEIVGNEMQMLDSRSQGMQGQGMGQAAGGMQQPQGGFNAPQSQPMGGSQGGSFNQQPQQQQQGGSGFNQNQQPAQQGGFNQQRQAQQPASGQNFGGGNNFNQQSSAPQQNQGGFNNGGKQQQGGFNQGGQAANTPQEPSIDFDDDIPF